MTTFATSDSLDTNVKRTRFFDGSSYFIDEKVAFLKFGNTYQVFNETGQNIGTISQTVSFGQKLLRLLLNKAMLPFRLEIRDEQGMLVASISRGWTFWMSKITIMSGDDKPIGTVRQKFKLFKPTFKIFNHEEKQIAGITGDWTAWNFQILNEVEQPVGTISKKWAGAMKEIFTTADKYMVKLDPSYSNMMNKIVVLSAAITIDMVLKESK